MPAREKEERSDSGEDNRIGQQESQEWVVKNFGHIFYLSPFTLRDSSQSPLIFFFSNVFQVERIVNCFYFYLRLQGLRNQLDCNSRLTEIQKNIVKSNYRIVRRKTV